MTCTIIPVKPQDEKHLKFLYRLLDERSAEVNIHHEKMPTYEDHVKFVQSEPYHAWYVICNDDGLLGSIYITKNDELGYFILKSQQRKGIATTAIKLLMERHKKKRYLANISPNNKAGIEFARSIGFKLIQHTYEYRSDPK